MRSPLSKVLILVVLVLSCYVGKGQSLPEILLHFSENEMEVPVSTRQKMVDSKGNTLLNYDNYKLNIYDKRARFLRITTPLEVTYEIRAWKIPGTSDMMVGLCETRCGISCGSTVRFYLPSEDWRQIPTEQVIPELSLDDIFSEKKLAKNYLTIATVLKDFQLKTQMIFPQTGNDIIVVFTCLDELEKSEYQRIFKYLDGAMLDLIWNKDGTFSKSDPYFSGN